MSHWRTKRLLAPGPSLTPWLAPQVAGAAAFLLMLAIPAKTQQGAANSNWSSYGGDTGNTRYSPLSQIDASNFSKLQVAWTFTTANLGPVPETNLESTPLVIDGVLYSTAGDRRDVVALRRRHWRVVVDPPRRRGQTGGSFAPGVCPGEGWPTGPMVMTDASSTSRKGIA